MPDLWFYGRGADITGPVAGPELARLAAGGTVLPTDTVWRDGVEDGVPAARVPGLFPLAPAVRSARAVAGNGVVIVGQDGVSVKYRGKCTACGREEAGWKTIPIPRGTARVGFFCPKCRKRRDGEIHGHH
jgi:hypothetical protein